MQLDGPYTNAQQILTHHVLHHAGIHASKCESNQKMCMIGHQAAGRSRTATLGISLEAIGAPFVWS
jgi:hypothetical protein